MQTTYQTPPTPHCETGSVWEVSDYPFTDVPYFPQVFIKLSWSFTAWSTLFRSCRTAVNLLTLLPGQA